MNIGSRGKKLTLIGVTWLNSYFLLFLQNQSEEMTSTPSTATISEKSAVRASSEKSSQEALTSAQSYTMIIIVAVSVTAMSLICIFLVLVYGFCCRQSQRSMPKLPPATSGVPLSAKGTSIFHVPKMYPQHEREISQYMHIVKGY